MTTSGHQRRRALLRTALIHAGVDALLVTDLVNIRYLTGFTGSNAALLVVGSDDEAVGDGMPVDGDPRTVFCTDGRYTTQSADEVPDLPRLIARPCDLALLGRAPAGVVGFEADCGDGGRSRRHADHGRATNPRGDRNWPRPADWSRGCARSRTPARSTRCARLRRGRPGACRS